MDSGATVPWKYGSCVSMRRASDAPDSGSGLSGKCGYWCGSPIREDKSGTIGGGGGCPGCRYLVHCALHLSSHLKPPPYMAGNSCGFGLRLWVTTKRARSPLRSLSLKETQRTLVSQRSGAVGNGYHTASIILHSQPVTSNHRSSLIICSGYE